MTCHYPDRGSASDWLNQISHAARPIRSTTQVWVVTRHQYGISALVSQPSFGGKTSGSVAKCRLFSQAKATDGRTQGELLCSCRQWCAFGCNKPAVHHGKDTTLKTLETMCNARARPHQCWKTFANESNIVAQRVGDNGTKDMLGVVGPKV